MSAIIMIPTITIVALVTIYLIGTIIFYIEQKPVANQSSFDIVALHLAWTTLHIGRSDPFDFFVKLTFSEKATKIDKIFTVNLTV